MPEMSIIVNEQDEVIGSKPRSEITVNDIYRVACIWITNSKGDILMAKRAMTKKVDPGKWGPAASGTLEEGETYESNILKETKEELGLDLKDYTLGPKQRRGGDRNYYRQWFFATIDKPLSEFKLNSDEVAELKWFTKEELLREIKDNPNHFNKGIVKRAVPEFLEKS